MQAQRTKHTYIRTRIDASTKENATIALASMGLSISDAVRMFMLKIADERVLPFQVKIPNAETLEAMAELEAGKCRTFGTIEELMADLDADD